MAIDPFSVKTAAQVRDDGLRALRNAARRRGITNIDTSPGSDYYGLFQAIGNEIEVIGAAQMAAGDAVMPDTAQDNDLDAWLARVGLARGAGGGSSGTIVLDATQATLVLAGTQLTDAQGQRHQVLAGGIYAPGASIPVQAVDIGTTTNRPAGELLRWATAPAYAATQAAVGPSGLTGGSDAEQDDAARARLMRRLAEPPGNGNSTQLIETAEASSPLVQAAFVYPAAQGPATQHVAVAGYASATSKSRAIDATVLASQIVPYVLGQVAEPVSAGTLVTGVADFPVDATIDLALPASGAASIPGPGGGWLDATPWPVPAPGESYAWVTFAGADNAFRVRASRAPVPGATRIAWLSPADWNLRQAIVTSAAAVAGTGTGGVAPEFDITVDTPFTGINVGHFISPQAAALPVYFNALLAAFAALGPGEKTANATVLARAYRRPVPTLAWPSGLDAAVLRAITNAGDEVLDVAYRFRTLVAPPLPASITDPPNIFVPRNLAFYPLGA